ncbi:styrene monooxygenase/indole monooxygenase family protein [Lihuaxuella thermophila]|uniref:2-polyprenyl-6-methoxyphenol hydroxylase n=1 Tax=Lihuaxuella thermophila TaxID=1173111 RepID=A0A1H8CSE2_9BACL|nr:styrene monooxygenase/indole monooxygenase family protein [Lihuaxuella thermophila]SEM97900.1 2-polyprenyl-6-methoxyphenol hydroxylase [Lihuaxuella thermophila]
MKKRICMIGSGTAGLQLAYALKDDFAVTVVQPRSAEEIRQGRIMSTQVHFGEARNREIRYGMPQWPDSPPIVSVHLTIGDQKLLTGMLKEAAVSVDQRLYWTACMEDLEAKGVTFRWGRIPKEKAGDLVREFDLVIDCTGKQGPLFPFQPVPELTRFDAPRRKCIVGYFVGVKPLEPLGVSATIIPEMGEMFEIPALTEYGPVTILFIEAIPDRELDVFKGIKEGEAFAGKMKEVVQRFFPGIAERIDEQTFALCDENAFLQTAVTPVIRKPYTMRDGRLVVACGDSAFLNDPITGQGCNLASYCAEQLADTIREHARSAWDEAMGEDYWQRVRGRVREVTEWTNAMTQPLPQHVVQFLLGTPGDQQKADQVAGWFAHPDTAHRSFFPDATP